VLVAQQPENEGWYAVRCLFQFWPKPGGDEPSVYEERITVWQADSFEQAFARADAEARQYAERFTRCEYVTLAQAFHIVAREQIGDGDEVFSLTRDSELLPDQYLERFFDRETSTTAAETATEARAVPSGKPVSHGWIPGVVSPHNDVDTSPSVPEPPDAARTTDAPVTRGRSPAIPFSQRQQLDAADERGSWRLDPTRRHQYRWWDGDRWTERVSDHGVRSVDAQTEPGQNGEPLPSSPPSRRGRRRSGT